MKQIVTLISFFAVVGFCSKIQAEELEMDFGFAEEALALRVLYQTQDTGCAEIVTTGESPLSREVRLDFTNPDAIFAEFDGRNVCIVALRNMDDTKDLKVRFSSDAEINLLMIDERWVTTGVAIEPGQTRFLPARQTSQVETSFDVFVQFDQSEVPPVGFQMSLVYEDANLETDFGACLIITCDDGDADAGLIARSEDPVALLPSANDLNSYDYDAQEPTDYTEPVSAVAAAYIAPPVEDELRLLARFSRSQVSGGQSTVLSLEPTRDCQLLVLAYSTTQNNFFPLLGPGVPFYDRVFGTGALNAGEQHLYEIQTFRTEFPTVEDQFLFLCFDLARMSGAQLSQSVTELVAIVRKEYEAADSRTWLRLSQRGLERHFNRRLLGASNLSLFTYN